METEVNIIKVFEERFKTLKELFGNLFLEVQKSFDDDAIHDLRVTTRRLLAFIDFLNELCGQSNYPDLRLSLRRFAKRFNKMRDIQVQIGYFINFVKKFPKTLDFLVELKKREKKQIKNLKKYIETSTLDEFSGLFFFYWSEIKNSNCFKNLSSLSLAETAEKTFDELNFAKGNIILGNYATYHKTRIALKKFRYTIEILEKIWGIEKTRIKELQQIQNNLGEIQDYSVMLTEIDKICSKRKYDMSNFFDFVEFIKQKREEKEKEFWNCGEIFDFWANFLKNDY
ncbi:MAG: CHAD domain-containing protein [Ignavibacteria bacterium]|nr:CHAD domain-containing protein [Ignavibacteria bacterium]